MGFLVLCMRVSFKYIRARAGYRYKPSLVRFLQLLSDHRKIGIWRWSRISPCPWSRYYIRPTIAYRWKEKTHLLGGFKFAYTDQDILPNTFEIRPWVGIKIYWPEIRRLTFQYFFRLEQRFQFNNGTDEWSSQTRGRYRLGTRVPLNHYTIIDKTFYMPLWAEIFRNAWGDLSERFASRLRLTAGLGYRFDKRWRLEFEYTYQSSRSFQEEKFRGSDNLFHLKLRWYH